MLARGWTRLWGASDPWDPPVPFVAAAPKTERLSHFGDSKGNCARFWPGRPLRAWAQQHNCCCLLLSACCMLVCSAGNICPSTGYNIPKGSCTQTVQSLRISSWLVICLLGRRVTDRQAFFALDRRSSFIAYLLRTCKNTYPECDVTCGAPECHVRPNRPVRDKQHTAGPRASQARPSMQPMSPPTAAHLVTRNAITAIHKDSIAGMRSWMST